MNTTRNSSTNLANPLSHRFFTLPAQAFTLIELLTVIAIIGILAAIIIPTVGKVRQSARQTQCVSNLRQIATALLLYTGDHRGYFPPGWQMGRPTVWQKDVAPYAGRSENASRGIDALGTIFECPSISAADLTVTGATSYAVNSPLLGNNASKKPLHQIDQPSRTVLAGDCRTTNTDFLSPTNISGDASTLVFRHPDPKPGDPAVVDHGGGLKSRGSGRANVAFCDAHVKAFKPCEIAKGIDNGVIWEP
ncbi:DUF1559 domain-containing protein [Geminisphaera colitermitum]|uniref:DUF1559 family PulG-like putative transporter n=1 Tax=Geminisphaera colitermitum TaxID=1148786 RepID=UPI000196510F|nr:DUF1559 domain-containing protein [Geminisphaera colitermitum]